MRHFGVVVGCATTAAICLFVTSSALAQTLYLDEQFGFSLTSGVIFASKPAGDPATNMDLRLELYEPSGAGVPTNRPVVVAIHGGGFTGGNRFSATQIGTCERMAMRGWTCISIDYRLTGDIPVVAPAYETMEALVSGTDPVLGAAIAAACEDTVAALEWLIANEVTLDIDTTRIGLAGYSAGGALTQFVPYLLDDTGVTLPVMPLAVFNLAGSFDPLFQIVSPGDPAAILVHGDLDTVVDPLGSIAMAGQLQAAGVPYELHILPGKTHAIDIFSDEIAPGETIFDRVVPFFVTYVANGPVALEVPALDGFGLMGLVLVLIGGASRALRPARR
jgi:acetyl esterase/lipase